MNRAESWETLVAALSAETSLVEELVRSALAMSGALGRLEVAAVERYTADQEAKLNALEQASKSRSRAIEQVAPGRGAFRGPLALQMVIAGAPAGAAGRLQGLHGRLVDLRDEFMLVRERNRMLIEQTLDFTRHFSESLAEAAADPPSYDATGTRSKAATRGELFSGAL